MKSPGCAVKRKLSSTAVLEKWYEDHRDYPYPSIDEKTLLAKETGLTLTQV